MLEPCWVTCPKVPSLALVSGPLCSVKGVEVVHREDGLPSFANVEVLFGVEVFQIQRWIPEFRVIPLYVGNGVLIHGGKRVLRVNLRDRDLADEIIPCTRVGGGA